MAKELRKISAEEFALRLKAAAGEEDKRFAFFIGAGCSVSSGVPAAGRLVSDHWLPKLRDLRAPHRRDLDVWAKEELGYDPENPAASYGAVMERLFLHREDRQREIERLCDGRFPGFGYNVLANLMALKSGCLNVALTTNFDDLIADALYLGSSAKPLVISHESLAGFIRPSSTRPLVVKLHGDYLLAPRNTEDETGELTEKIGRQVRAILHERGLIFMGYGGNDTGIRDMLAEIADDELPFGVYWVSESEPRGRLRPWLEEREAIWIQKNDFDVMMLLFRDAFDVPPPDRSRFDRVFENYTDTYKELSGRIIALPEDAPDAAALKDAVKSTDKSLPDEWGMYVAAHRLEDSDPEAARAEYENAIEKHPRSGLLLGQFARFLDDILDDKEQAEVFYKRALDAEPNQATNLGNYAVFLDQERQDYQRAEELYKGALEAEPDNAIKLSNFAGFLLAHERDVEGLAMLDRALELRDTSRMVTPACEAWFYALAHWPAERRSEAMKNLKSVIEGGVRSPRWDFSANIARAREDGHPDVEWLEKLAAVIADGADISTLDGWEAWEKA